MTYMSFSSRYCCLNVEVTSLRLTEPKSSEEQDREHSKEWFEKIIQHEQ